MPTTIGTNPSFSYTGLDSPRMDLVEGHVLRKLTTFLFLNTCIYDMNPTLLQKLFESEDLKRHIYSFGSEEHRRLMRDLRSKLEFDLFHPRMDTDGLLTDVPDKFKYTKWHLLKAENHTMRESFLSFYRYRSCRCCSRHSHNKPDIRLKHGKLLFLRNQTLVPECKNLQDCPCYCRTEARYLWSLIRHRCLNPSPESDN